MDTLPDDLLILVANVIDNLPAAELVFPPGAKYIQVLIDKYMKCVYDRIVSNLTRYISPEVLEFIIRHNLTISGSFVLASICDVYWGGDLDIICKEDLSKYTLSKLHLSNNYYSSFYSKMKGVHRLYSNKDYAYSINKNPTLIDVIVLIDGCSADDLLKEYDFDFVKNSLEFLPNGTKRLTIKHPTAVWDRRCHLDINCYGINNTNDKPSIESRLSRLVSRVSKYRHRGFVIKYDKKNLDELVSYMRSFKIKPHPSTAMYVPNYQRLEDLHALFT